MTKDRTELTPVARYLEGVPVLEARWHMPGDTLTPSNAVAHIPLHEYTPMPRVECVQTMGFDVAAEDYTRHVPLDTRATRGEGEF